jgi:hypothetical protein
MTLHPYDSVHLVAARQARYLDEAATARMAGRRRSWLRRRLASLRRRRPLAEPTLVGAVAPAQPPVDVVGEAAVV